MRSPLEYPITCLITPGNITTANFSACQETLLKRLHLAVSAGISLFQIREKSLNGRLLFLLTSAIVQAASGTGIKIVVNDRADIALAAGADGVHLPSAGLGVEDVRRICANDLLIGVSAHTIHELTAAEANGADYAFYGPVFPTPDKGPAIGIAGLAEGVRAVNRLSILALGGIDRRSVDEVLSTGASGFAAIRFLNDPVELEYLAERRKNG